VRRGVDRRAVSARVDAHRDLHVAARCDAETAYPSTDRGGIGVAEPGVSRSQQRADARPRLRAVDEDRVIARPSVVPRIGAGQGTLLRAEDALDGGVHVEVDRLGLHFVYGGEPLLGHHHLQVGDRRIVESAQVPVHGIDARHDSTRETNEERIGRERFEAEDTRLSERQCSHRAATAAAPPSGRPPSRCS